MKADDEAAKPNTSCGPLASDPRITSSRVRLGLSPHETHTYLKESSISLQNEQHVTSIGPSPSDCSMACNTSGDTLDGSAKGSLSEEGAASSRILPYVPARPQDGG